MIRAIRQGTMEIYKSIKIAIVVQKLLTVRISEHKYLKEHEEK